MLGRAERLAGVGHTGSVRRLGTEEHPRWLVALLIVAIGVYAWEAAGLRPLTGGEEVMGALAALRVLASARDGNASRHPFVARLQACVAGVGGAGVRVGALRVLLVTERAASDPERDRRRGHE